MSSTNQLNDDKWQDMPDMLDHEVVAVYKILADLRQKYGHRVNNYANLREMTREAKERILNEQGWVVDVDLLPCIQINPATKQPFPPILTFVKRITPLQEFDHEQKRWEVLKSKERKEDLLGQKGKTA